MRGATRAAGMREITPEGLLKISHLGVSSSSPGTGSFMTHTPGFLSVLTSAKNNRHETEDHRA